MLETNYPPKKDHLATAKMLEIYELSALTQLDMIKAYANSKPFDDQAAYELKLRINLANAWYQEIKKIRKSYFNKLHDLAMIYMDYQLEIFSYGIIKKDSIEKVAKKVGKPIEEVKSIIERFEEDMDLISLTE
jgi:hypothetical protein